MSASFVKDSSAVLDYEWDWSQWLTPLETITGHTVTADTGITVNSHTADTTTVTVWLSGGTAGNRYGVTCHIVTSAGREDDRTITIQAMER